jgi:hypothetical protein
VTEALVHDVAFVEDHVSVLLPPGATLATLAESVTVTGEVFGGGFCVLVHAMALRVRGPTYPYPVVSGVPEDTMPWDACQDFTAVSVKGPKYPVVGSTPRNAWSAETPPAVTESVSPP